MLSVIDSTFNDLKHCGAVSCYEARIDIKRSERMETTLNKLNTALSLHFSELVPSPLEYSSISD
jgi:hypothetical protein